MGLGAVAIAYLVTLNLHLHTWKPDRSNIFGVRQAITQALEYRVPVNPGETKGRLWRLGDE